MKELKIYLCKGYSDSCRGQWCFQAGDERTYTLAEVFPEYHGKEGRTALRAYRNRENLTQAELARMTGIPQHQISEMETGKRTIGEERARKLAQALNVSDFRYFL